MRVARVLGDGTSCYHCISRVVDRNMRISGLEKEKFREIMRKVEGFSAVQILTYAILDNHFHILVEIPEREEVSDQELVRRMGFLYSRVFVRQYGALLQQYREAGDQKAADKMKEKYTYRMYDLGEFMKTLKQRYTMSYNGRNRRRGTLWEERYKSVLVERPKPHEKVRELSSSAAMAAYIDLNPVRAGIVKDPKDYRYSGYGEAMGGSKKARAGLLRVIGTLGWIGSWGEIAKHYRQLLYIRGERTKKKAGFSPEKVDKVLEEGGKLSTSEILHCRVRYFSDGMVLGSRDFVNSTFSKYRDRFGAKRKDGAREMKYGHWEGLCAMRDLRLAVVTVPK